MVAMDATSRGEETMMNYTAKWTEGDGTVREIACETLDRARYLVAFAKGAAFSKAGRSRPWALACDVRDAKVVGPDFTEGMVGLGGFYRTDARGTYRV